MYILKLTAISSRDGKRRSAILCSSGMEKEYSWQMKPEVIARRAVTFKTLEDAKDFGKALHVSRGETLTAEYVS